MAMLLIFRDAFVQVCIQVSKRVYKLGDFISRFHQQQNVIYPKNSKSMAALLCCVFG
jgi:hypothetical protein